MSNHTPGPWTVFRCMFANEEPEQACGLNGQTFDASHDECHHMLKLEDAVLMSAAPDLLEACKLAVKSWFSGEVSEVHMEVVLRAAIAKAEGKQ